MRVCTALTFTAAQHGPTRHGRRFNKALFLPLVKWRLLSLAQSLGGNSLPLDVLGNVGERP